VVATLVDQQACEASNAGGYHANARGIEINPFE
jgi:hypothetical protein